MILTESARKGWRNFNYLAEGPIVAQFLGLFADRWQELGGAPAGPVPAPRRSSPTRRSGSCGRTSTSVP